MGLFASLLCCVYKGKEGVGIFRWHAWRGDLCPRWIYAAMGQGVRRRVISGFQYIMEKVACEGTEGCYSGFSLFYQPLFFSFPFLSIGGNTGYIFQAKVCRIICFGINATYAR